jgi:SSS family solute:Na+ symporter
MFVASMMTAPPSAEKIAGLTYGAVSAEDLRRTRESWTSLDVISSVIVCLLILAAYIYFTG